MKHVLSRVVGCKGQKPNMILLGRKWKRISSRNPKKSEQWNQRWEVGRAMNQGCRKFQNQKLQHHQNSLALSLLPLMYWLQFLSKLVFFLSLFYLFMYFNNLYTQYGTWTHNPESKRHMLFKLSQPCAPKLAFFIYLEIWHSQILHLTISTTRKGLTFLIWIWEIPEGKKCSFLEQSQGSREREGHMVDVHYSTH